MDVPNKKLGIMMYIDDAKSMLEHFSWIYKSWIYSGCWKTSDLIVVHHPALDGRLPKEPGIILIPQEPYSDNASQFHKYAFINSIACLSGPHIDNILMGYQWLLRTDADVFLTHHLANFRPNYPVHGRGEYYHMADFREKMLDFCQRHGVQHRHRFGCGHSVLLKSASMIKFLQRQMYWSERLVEDFGTDKANWGAWPGWSRGVMSMYAAEITANESWDEYLRHGRDRILDVGSNNGELIDSLTLHIHATHADYGFSKFSYGKGEYNHIDPQTLDRNRIDHYCMWICLTPVDDIKALAGYVG